MYPNDTPTPLKLKRYSNSVDVYVLIVYLLFSQVFFVLQ